MKSISYFDQIYLYRLPIDFRKQINGLSALVEEEIKLSIYEKNLFVFTNKDRNRIKILYWDRTGFALWLKRLEKNRFKWPKNLTKEIIELETKELEWLLDGYDLSKMKPHKTLKYNTVY